jgi:tetratricopeptide (TPR) repeat protein
VIVRDRLDAEAARVVARMTRASPQRPPAALTALAAAPWRAVITTAFDESWTRALAATGETPVVLSAGEPVTAQNGRLLIHAFGRAARAQTLCLAPVDLPRVGAHGLQAFLRDLARAHTFIYVGFQAGDPDLEWLTDQVLGAAALARSHFVLVPGSAEGTATLFPESFGLQPIAFDGSLERGLSALARAATTLEAPRPTPVVMEASRPTPVPVVAPRPTPLAVVAPRPTPVAVVAPRPKAVPVPALRPEADLELETGEVDLGEEEVVVEDAVEDNPPADAAGRARYLHTRALALRDEQGDRAGAIALLEQALEADPTMVPAWDALEPLQRGGGDSIALRRCYARALKALGKTADPALSLRLWNGLAEVSWRALGDHPTAVAAFEVARTLDPDDEGPERALGALYLKVGPSASEKAVAVHQALAARAPDEPEPYRVLEQLWTAEHAPQKAFWASAVLEQLGQATDHQAEPVKLTAFARPVTLARTLSEPLWECLCHPDEDRVLSTLFMVLSPSLLALVADPQHRFPPRRAEAVQAVDPTATRPSRGAAGPFGGAFAPAALAHVARALAVPAPTLYLVRSARRPLTVRLRAGGPTVRHALILDRRFADQAPEADVLFELARTVALLRPPWLLRFGRRVPAVLDLGLRAADALSETDFPTGGRPKGDVRRLLQNLREARPDLAQEQVAALASELDHRPDPPDLRRWLAAIELSAARAALVLTGDLAAAVRRVSADRARPGGLAPTERVKDLLAFAVSEDHFAVRAALALDAPEGSEALG